MKIRLGFVSNSSSSSFICDICKIQFGTGQEDEPGEYPEVICKNNHEFCYDCACKHNIYGLSREKVSENCPICKLEICSDTDIKQYLLLKFETFEENILKEIKDKFKTRDVFDKFLKGEEKCSR